MKNIIIAIIAFVGISNTIYAQNINWRAFNEEQNSIIHINTGFDYGVTFGLGYSQKFNTQKPMAVGIEYSFPSGENLFDDFKVRIGGQMELVRIGGFSSTLKINGIFRRYEHSQTRLINWGGEFVGIFGYYKPKWFVAGEFGFDKAIITHVKHSASAIDQNAGLRSGWYIPAGGNFSYGLQTGITFRKTDLTLKVGQVIAQDFKTLPLLPLYAQLGVNKRF
jgi:hypothetical protein